MTGTVSPTATPTASPTGSQTPSASPSASPTGSASATATRTWTGTPSVSPTETRSPTLSASQTASETATPRPTPTPTATSQVGALAGHVWLDVNNNGLQDSEANLAGVQVELYDSQGVTHTVVTDASGNFSLFVPVGPVTVSVNLGGPGLPASPVVTTGNSPQVVAVTAGLVNATAIGVNTAPTPTPTFSPVPPGSTLTQTPSPSPSWTATGTGTPTATATQSASPTPTLTATGTASPVESGTPNATQTLAPSATWTPTATPSFTNVPAGSTETETLTPAPTATATPTASPTATATCSWTPTPSVTQTAQEGSLTGKVFWDQDRSGVQGSQPSLPNVQVFVYSPGWGVTQTAVTDAFGFFSLLVPAGPAVLSVNLAGPGLPYAPSVTTGNQPQTVTMVADQPTSTSWFGVVGALTPTPTLSSSPTATQTQSATASPSATLTASPTQSVTARPSASISASPTLSATPTPRSSASVTASPTASATPRGTATASPTPGSPTPTATGTPAQGTLSITLQALKPVLNPGDPEPWAAMVGNPSSLAVSNYEVQVVLPVGFRYVPGTAAESGSAVDPIGGDGRILYFPAPPLQPGQSFVLSILSSSSLGLTTGNYTATAVPLSLGAGSAALAVQASATVKVEPDPEFTDALVFGKVFLDANKDGRQDPGEAGIAGVRVATTSGLLLVTDSKGRYHLEGIQDIEEGRGSNTVFKVDPASLPLGAVFTTENPRMVRLTQGMATRVDFGVWWPDCGKEGRQVKVRSSFRQEVAVLFVPCTVRLAEGATDALDHIVALAPTVDQLQLSLQAGALCEAPMNNGNLAALRLTIVQQYLKAHLSPELFSRISVVNSAGPPTGAPDAAPAPGATPAPTATPAPSAATPRLWGRTLGAILFLLSGEGHSEALAPAAPGSAASISGSAVVDGYTVLTGVAEGKVEPYEISNDHFTLRPQFDSGKADLHPLDAQFIEALVRDIPGMIQSMTVSGHTDNERLAPETRAVFTDNKGLSLARAEAVKDAILAGLQKYGKPMPQEVHVIGEGKNRPIAPNTTLEGMALNRRVELDMVTMQPTNRKGVKAVLTGSIETVTEDLAEPSCILQMNDPRGADRVLSAVLGQQPVAVRDGKGSAQFFLYCNYPDYFTQWELVIGRGHATPVRRIKGAAADFFKPVRWDLLNDLGRPVEPGSGYTFRLVVMDAEGRRDETKPQPFSVVDAALIPAELPGRAVALSPGAQSLEVGAATDSAQAGPSGFDKDQAGSRQIPVLGALVSLSAHFPAGTSVQVNGEDCHADPQGRWVWRRILKEGVQKLDTEARLPGGGVRSFARDVDVKPFDFFSVGLADLNLGYRQVEGHVEAVNATDLVTPGFFSEGHLGFYLKGRIKGGWLLTAQMDTGEQPLNQVFQHLDRFDPQTVFHRLDPEAYYPVYGDGSYTVIDVDTPGRLFLLLEKDRCSLRWGSVALRWDAPVGSVSRTLYGARVQAAQGVPGGTEAGVDAFAADDSSVHAHDNLRGTGGSLYYLSHGMVVFGSERLAVELRDPATGQVLSTEVLESGKDYQIDWLAGRVVLSQPLQAYVAGPGVTSAGTASGDGAYLVADYDYDSGFDPVHQGAYGGRAFAGLGDAVKAEVRADSEDTSAGRHDLAGAGVKVQPLKGLNAGVDLAASRQQAEPVQLSADGGLTYVQLSPTSADWAGALHANLDADLGVLLPAKPDLDLGGFVEERKAGFADASQATLNDFRSIGAYSHAGLLGGGKLDLGFGRQESAASALETDSASFSQALFRHFTLKAELDRRLAEDAGLPDLDAALGALRVDWNPGGAWTIYARQQASLWRTDATPVDDATTLGLTAQLTRTLKASAEVQDGSLGASAKLGLESQVSGALSVYGSTTLSDDPYQGTELAGTLGERWKANRYVDAYSESKLSMGEAESGQTQTFGLHFAPEKRWDFSADYSLGDVNVGQANSTLARYQDRGLGGSWIPQQGYGSDGSVDREVLGAGLAFTDEQLKARLRYQVRWDSGAQDLLQNVFAGSLQDDINDAWSALCKLDTSVSQPRDGGADIASYALGTLGLALRPWDDDRVNLMAKLSYLEDLGPAGQAFTIASVDQRAWVASGDVNLELGRYLELGERGAWKWGEVDSARGADDWTAEQTVLWINRLNVHLVFKLDALGEYRVLWNDLSQSSEQGFLAGFSYHVQKYVELGAGYNFTDFNDNLTVLNYTSRGPYINVAGKW